MPACGRFSARTRRTPSSIARPPTCCRRRGSCRRAFRTTPSSTTGSRGPDGGTVSRWAQKKSGVPPPSARGGRRCSPRRADLGAARRPRPARGRDRGGSAARRRRPRAPRPAGSASRRAPGRGRASRFRMPRLDPMMRAPTSAASTLIQTALVGEALDERPRARLRRRRRHALHRGQRVRLRRARLHASGASRPRRLRRRPRSERGEGVRRDARTRLRHGETKLTRKDGSEVAFFYRAARTIVAGLELFVAVGFLDA